MSGMTKMVPFFVGVYVLFAAFWPQRVLFFSAAQRRNTTGGMLYTWTLAAIVLTIAISINTAFVDEITRLLDENIPLMRVVLVRKLGWTLSAAAFGCAYAAVFCSFVAALILRVRA